MDKFIVEYGGRDVELDLDADLAIDDLDEGMKKIASTYAWYAVLHASEKRKADTSDDQYRQWKGKEIENRLAHNPKESEWKMHAFVESQIHFAKHKARIRRHEENAAVLFGALKALEIKANMLRSIGVKVRSELDMTGMETSREPVQTKQAISKRPERKEMADGQED